MTVNVDQPTRAPRFVSLFSSVLQRQESEPPRLHDIAAFVL